MTEQRAKITKRVVDAAEPLADDRYCIWDTEIKGFRLRVMPTGRKVYELRYRIGSRQRLSTIGTHGSPWTPDAARDRAKAMLFGLTVGDDPQVAKEKSRQAMTVSDLIELYLQQGPADKPEKRASSWTTDKYNLCRHAEPVLGKRVARDVSTSDFSQWQAAVAAGKTAVRAKSDVKHASVNVRGGPGAAARAMRTVAAMFAWAKNRGLLEDNPAAAVAKIKDGRRERYLSDEEAKSLWDAVARLEGATDGGISSDQADAFRLLMLTGARRGEVLGLRWAEVDLRRKLLLLPPLRHKMGGSSRPKAIPLPAAAATVLARRNRTGEYVFGSTDADKPLTPQKAAWKRVLTAAGVTDASFHVLRHTLASFAIADGASLYVVGKALGHAKAESTQRYAHLRDDATAKAAEGAAGRYTRPQAESAKEPMSADEAVAQAGGRD
jgi:integrase